MKSERNRIVYRKRSSSVDRFRDEMMRGSLMHFTPLRHKWTTRTMFDHVCIELRRMKSASSPHPFYDDIHPLFLMWWLETESFPILSSFDRTFFWRILSNRQKLSSWWAGVESSSLSAAPQFWQLLSCPGISCRYFYSSSLLKTLETTGVSFHNWLTDSSCSSFFPSLET